MTETTETETTAKPRPKGDKRNIPKEIHRLASALSRQLLRMPDNREDGNQESSEGKRTAEGGPA